MTSKNQKKHQETKYVCPICGEHIDRKGLPTHIAAEEYVLKKIRDTHPDWVKSDGACPKCWEAYRNLGPQPPG